MMLVVVWHIINQKELFLLSLSKVIATHLMIEMEVSFYIN